MYCVWQGKGADKHAQTNVLERTQSQTSPGRAAVRDGGRGLLTLRDDPSESHSPSSQHTPVVYCNLIKRNTNYTGWQTMLSVCPLQEGTRGVLQKAVLPKGIMCNLVTSYAYVYKEKSKCFKWQHLKFGVFFMNKVFMVTWEKCIPTVG